jgi:urate oxidase
MSSLSAARYGKANVRVLKVWRDPNDRDHQAVIELTVRVLLEGEIEESYTKADNSPVVPTDTVKNTIYILAKQNEVWPIEQFGATLVNHFISRYPHIHAAHADIVQHRWTRYDVQGKPHPHSFVRDGAETRLASVSKKDDGSPFQITSGIKDLTVLKSTGSMFHGYHMCEYTTLKPTWDRILSTDVDSSWTWTPSAVSSYAKVKMLAANGIFDGAWEGARNTTLETFALENSASVQATMYNMCQSILKEFKHIDDVSYSLPNKHYFEIDLSWHKGLQNTGKDAEVYASQSNPNGLIKCTVSRNQSAKL